MSVNDEINRLESKIEVLKGQKVRLEAFLKDLERVFQDHGLVLECDSIFEGGVTWSITALSDNERTRKRQLDIFKTVRFDA